jgi:competence protein ComEC
MLKIFRNIPFVRFSFALGAGIYCANFIKHPISGYLYLSLAVVFILLLLVVMVPAIYQKYKNRWLPGFSLFCLLFLLGILLHDHAKPSIITGEYKVKGIGIVHDADETVSGYYRFYIQPVKVVTPDSLSIEDGDMWQIFVPPNDTLQSIPASLGDKVLFETVLRGHDPPTNPASFDYGQYLFRLGVSGSGFVKSNEFEVLAKGRLSGISHELRRVREQTRQVYIDYDISGDNLQVLSALTLGMRKELSREVKNWFIRSGAVHILAVSGLHVGIIFLFLNALLSSFLPRRSFVKMLVVVLVLIFFALLTGGAPSVVRAVVMLSVIQVGNYFNRKGNIYNLLGVSAFIILLIQPMSLFHAGFWLSHLAVAGIVTFFPIFRKWYAGGNLFVRGIGDLAAVSFSAQIATFPLSVYLFKAFPSYFLLTNFMILPLVAPILISAKLLIIFSQVPFLASMFAGVLNGILDFMNAMVKWLDGLPSAYIEGFWLGGLTMVFLYLFLSAIMLWYHTRLRFLFKFSLLSLLGVLIILNFEYWQKQNTNALVVFDIGRNNPVGIIKEGKGVLFADNEMSDRDISFGSSGFFTKHALDVDRREIACFSDSKSKVSVFPVAGGCYIGVGAMNVDSLQKNESSQINILGVILMVDVD